MRSIIIENRSGKWFVNYKPYNELTTAEKSFLNGFFKAMKIEFNNDENI